MLRRTCGFSDGANHCLSRYKTLSGTKKNNVWLGALLGRLDTDVFRVYANVACCAKNSGDKCPFKAYTGDHCFDYIL